MTDNEIIKALVCCKDNSFNSFPCEKCPYPGTRGCCVNNLCEDALYLISRQRAEIERLKDMVAQNEGVLPKYEALIRAEAVKEFAERLKGDNFKVPVDAFTSAYVLGDDDIDQIAKEMGQEG